MLTEPRSKVVKVENTAWWLFGPILPNCSDCWWLKTPALELKVNCPDELKKDFQHGLEIIDKI